MAVPGPMIRAVVLGATGLVGGHLVRMLLADDRFARVRVLVRRPTGILDPRLDEHIIDFDNPESWAALVEGDVLFLALGTTKKAAGSEDAQYRVDVVYQLDAAIAAYGNDVPNLVLVSAAGADPEARFFYPRIRGELEKAVLSLEIPHITILRPSVLVGERREKRMGERMAIGVMGLASRISGKLARYKPIPAETVARAMLRAAVYPAPEHRVVEWDDIFSLAGSEGAIQEGSDSQGTK